MHNDMDIAGKYRFGTATVNDLAHGDLFSLDGGQTWYIAAEVLFGAVAVYAGERRDEGAPTTRVSADRDAEVLRLEPPTATRYADTFEIPTIVYVAGPDDEDCPVWRVEEPNGRHAVVLSHIDDLIAVGYVGTLPELMEFAARVQAALHEAQLRQQAGPDATDTPPPQPDAVVTSRVVTIYDLTARQRAELADELGVDRSVRRLPRGRDASGALTGVKLDSQYGYDIDAAVAYARRAGLRYVEVREITFESC